MIKRIILPAFAAALLFGLNGAASFSTPESDLIQKLKTTTSFCGAHTGFAGVKGPNYLAYEQALKEGAKIRKGLDDVLANGSPAGRLYAAMLIRKLDKDAGDKALKSLLSEKAEVDYCLGGCGIIKYTVGQAAKQLLSHTFDPLSDQASGE